MSTSHHSSTDSRLLLHERTAEDGGLEKIWLEVAAGALLLAIDGGARKVLPLAVLDAVMRRYGKTLAEDIELTGPRLELGEGYAVGTLRHLARYDVIAKDFVVYEPPGEEPLAELATSVTAALSFLLRAAPAA